MIYLFIGIGTAAFIVFLWWWRKRKLADIEKRVDKIKNRQTLPSGLRLRIEEGVNQPTQGEIQAIEAGMLECFGYARAEGYDRPLDLRAYEIAIVQSIRAPESRLWCYKLPAGAYAGTQWDLGGYILAAGQMLRFGEIDGNLIVLPDHHGTDLDWLKIVSRYEVEHPVLAVCDPEKFEATKVHGAGQGHPTFGPDAFAGLIDNPELARRYEMLRTGLIK